MKFCMNCGSQLNETSKFCPKCGIPVVEKPTITEEPVVSPFVESPVAKKSSKFTKPLLAIIGVLIVIFAVVFFFSQETVEETTVDETIEIETAQGIAILTWQEQYDLGMKYLADGNYEEAIIAFEVAIELDPKNEDSYIALADTYIVMGDLEQAIEVLDRGYTQTKSDTLLNMQEDITSQINQIKQENAEKQNVTYQAFMDNYNSAYYINSYQIFDIDGDGVAELLLQIEEAEPEFVPYESGSELYTMADGEVIFVDATKSANSNSAYFYIAMNDNTGEYIIAREGFSNSYNEYGPGTIIYQYAEGQLTQIISFGTIITGNDYGDLYYDSDSSFGPYRYYFVNGEVATVEAYEQAASQVPYTLVEENIYTPALASQTEPDDVVEMANINAQEDISVLWELRYDVAYETDETSSSSIVFHQDGTYDFDVNIYVGLEHEGGTYSVSENTVTCYVTDKSWRGVVGDDLYLYVFNIYEDMIIFNETSSSDNTASSDVVMLGSIYDNIKLYLTQ